MSVFLECKKVKRTGFLLAFFGGGILAAAVPIINMAVRSEMYLNQPDSPIQILLGANWQMMTMLNVLLVIAGACLLYHTEYADNAMQKMKSLPIRESSIFFSKAVLIIFMSLFVLVIEAGAVTLCSYHWFEIESDFFSELCKYFGYSFLLMLPCIMLPTTNFALSLFPFAMPFQIFVGTNITQSTHYICGAIAEFAVCGLAQFIFVKVRRLFE